jgi:hypothetical protein
MTRQTPYKKTFDAEFGATRYEFSSKLHELGELT